MLTAYFICDRQPTYWAGDLHWDFLLNRMNIAASRHRFSDWLPIALLTTLVDVDLDNWYFYEFRIVYSLTNDRPLGFVVRTFEDSYRATEIKSAAVESATRRRLR